MVLGMVVAGKLHAQVIESNKLLECIEVTTWSQVTPITNLVWSNETPIGLIDTNQIFSLITSQTIYRQLYTNGTQFLTNHFVCCDPTTNNGCLGCWYSTNHFVTSHFYDPVGTLDPSNIVRQYAPPIGTNWALVTEPATNGTNNTALSR